MSLLWCGQFMQSNMIHLMQFFHWLSCWNDDNQKLFHDYQLVSDFWWGLSLGIRWNIFFFSSVVLTMSYQKKINWHSLNCIVKEDFLGWSSIFAASFPQWESFYNYSSIKKWITVFHMFFIFIWCQLMHYARFYRCEPNIWEKCIQGVLIWEMWKVLISTILIMWIIYNEITLCLPLYCFHTLFCTLDIQAPWKFRLRAPKVSDYSTQSLCFLTLGLIPWWCIPGSFCSHFPLSFFLSWSPPRGVFSNTWHLKSESFEISNCTKLIKGIQYDKLQYWTRMKKMYSYHHV